MNLLIVDDEPMALEEIREVVLEVKNDICVKCCDNYMDALENAKIKKYDVAFLDISMPCMNGLEIAKNLKVLHAQTRSDGKSALPGIRFRTYTVPAAPSIFCHPGTHRTWYGSAENRFRMPRHTAV